jgi:HAD superfamily hydrolase (TIGR01509 family)
LYNDLCVSVGRPPLREREIPYVHSRTVYEAIRYLFSDDEDLEKKALEQLKKIHLRDYIIHLKMEPHLLETLEWLKKKGIHRAINTNRTTSMPFIMERFNLRPYFDMVVTALDVKHPKPHPESIEKIIKALNVNREEILYVGDSEVDRQTASASGVRFVAYKNKRIVETIFIQDHLELLAFVSE